MTEQFKKYTILLVDDEADFRNILKIKLEAVGFNTIEAANGREVITILESAHPDIILLDMMMPEMDGIETLFKIKGNDKTRSIRVIMLTGKGDPREEIMRMNKKFAQESGAFDYLRKEADLSILIDRINKILAEDRKS